MSDCKCQPDVVVGCGPSLEVEIPAIPPAGPTGGNKEKAVVTSTGPVCKHEFVRKELEWIAVGDVLRWTVDDVSIMDTAELSEGRVGVVFTQNGKTKFKVLSLENGEVAMGNTITLPDIEDVEEATVVELARNRAAVLYNQDGDGMAAVFALDGRKATLDYTDIWGDGGDPANLTACVLGSGWLLISATLRDKTVRDGGHPGECWVYGFKEDSAKKTISGEYLIAERMDGDNDTDTYAGAWSMAAVDTNTAVLCFPRALDKPVGFAIIDVGIIGSNDGGIKFRCIGAGKYAASLPTIQAVGLDRGRWLMAYGVCWMTSDNQVAKSALAFEVWGLSRYAAELLYYGCDDARYKASMGGISVTNALFGAAVTYTGSATVEAPDGSHTTVDTTKAVYIGMECGPAPGAAVSLPANSGWSRVVPISVTKALLIYQDGGNGYAQAMTLEERVIPVSGSFAKGKDGMDGFAITGGAANATITIQTP